MNIVKVLPLFSAKRKPWSFRQRIKLTWKEAFSERNRGLLVLGASFFFFFLLFATSVQAATQTAFGNIPSEPGALASRFLQIGLALGGGVSLLLMIIAAFKMITSRGNPDALQESKDKFTAAILGLLFIIFATLILRLIGQDIIGIPEFGLNFNFNAYALSVPGSNIQEPPDLNPQLNSVGSVISAFLPAVIALAGMVAFIFLLMGGFKYLIARGDQKAVEDARKTITGAFIGLIIILGVFLIINILEAILGLRLTQIPAAYAASQPGPSVTPPRGDPIPLPPNTVDIGRSFTFGNQGISFNFPSFGALITSTIKVVLPLAGIIFFFMLLWGGVRFMTSLGDEKAKASARSIITSAVIGLLIILGSFLIMTVIQTITGINFLG